MDPAAFQNQMQQQMMQWQQAIQQQLAAAAVAPNAPAGGGGAGRPKLPSPPQYDGASAKLDDWSNDLRQQFEWYAMSTDVARLQFAVAFLKGAARDWWTNLDAGTRPLTWADFEAALRRRFQPVTAAETARSKLLAIAQGKAHVNEYIEVFRRLLAYVPDMSASDRLFQFLRGLRPDIAKHIRMQGIQALDAAVEAAARIGSLGEIGASSSSASASSSSSSAAAPMDLSAMLSSAGDGIEGLEQAASTDQAANAVVTRAELTQLLNAMREFRKGPSGASGGGQSNRDRFPRRDRGPPRIAHLTPDQVQEYMTAGKCFGCGLKDHMSRACPKRKVGADGRVSWSN